MPRREIKFNIVVKPRKHTEEDMDYVVHRLIDAYEKKKGLARAKDEMDHKIALQRAMERQELYREKLMEQMQEKLRKHWMEEYDAALKCDIDG